MITVSSRYFYYNFRIVFYILLSGLIAHSVAKNPCQYWPIYIYIFRPRLYGDVSALCKTLYVCNDVYMNTFTYNVT